jgi:polygalacturonase
MTLHAVRFRGHTLDFTAMPSDMLRVLLLLPHANAIKAETEEGSGLPPTLTLTPAGGKSTVLVPGVAVTLPAHGAVLISASNSSTVHAIKTDDKALVAGDDTSKVFYITDYGAKGDGKLASYVINTAAIAHAFAAAALASAPSTVAIPKGDFFSGPIAFSANSQTLALAEGARLIAAYPAYGNMTHTSCSKSWKKCMSWPIGPKEPEGQQSEWDTQYAPFIYAHNLTGVSLLGPGTVDGGGEEWWELKHKTGKGGKFPKGMPQRPYNVRFDGCTHVLVRDLVMVQPPFWNLVPTWCTDVEIHNVTIRAIPGESGVPAYNTDGIEPMYSVGVHIADCFIINGDDSITIKSGSHDVLVENCIFQDGHGCNIGSVQGLDISNVTFRNIQLNNTLLGGGRIKARHWVDNWVTVSDILFENISCVPGVAKCSDNSVAEILMDYGGGPMGKAGVTVRNATWRNINVTGAHPGSLACLPGNPCQGITIENVHVSGSKTDFNCSYCSGHAEGNTPAAINAGNCLNAPPQPPKPSPPPSPSPSPHSHSKYTCTKKKCVSNRNGKYNNNTCDGKCSAGPPPPGPGPPAPSGACAVALAASCPGEQGKGTPCKTCVHTNGGKLKVANCWPGHGENAFVKQWCKLKDVTLQAGDARPSNFKGVSSLHKSDDEEGEDGAQSQPQCAKFEKGIKLGTDKLKTTAAASAAACCQLCTAEPKCVVFSFHDVKVIETSDSQAGFDTVNSKQTCELCAKLGESKPKNGFTSGIVRGVIPSPPHSHSRYTCTKKKCVSDKNGKYNNNTCDGKCSAGPPPPVPPGPAPPGPNPDPDPAVDAYKRKMGLVQHGALRFGAVSMPTSIKVGDLFEIAVNLTASFDNPYNSSDVALDANFTFLGEPSLALTPLSVPGFFYTPFQQDSHGTVLPASRGAPSWHVRFSPRKTGAWSCTLTARDRSGRTQYTGPPLHFTVVARARTDSARGWLAISNKQPLALVESMCPKNIFSTSSAFAGQETPGECGFHAVGANLLYFHDTRRAQPIDRLSTYLAFLRNLSTHGGNYGKLSGHATLSSLSTFRCLLRPVLCDEQPF